MKYNSKAAVCDYVNEQHKTNVDELSTNYVVKVPVYTNAVKKIILNSLTPFFDVRKIDSPYGSRRVSLFDFSKLIKPDEWKEYNITIGQKMALEQFVIEHEYVWEVELSYEFYQEDLRYGIRPIEIYDKLTEYGGGSVLVDKETGEIYYIYSRIWVNYDYVKDFSLYKEGKKTELIWGGHPDYDKYPIVG